MLRFITALIVATATSAALAQAQTTRSLAALAGFLQRDAEGFASSETPWRFRFPHDHAAHREHRMELWRFTGTAVSADDAKFGFQLTFGRAGIVPPAVALGPSAWAAREAYWAHFALTDAAGKREYRFDHLARAAMGLSGSSDSPIRIWVSDWSMELREQVFHLQAEKETVALKLALRPAKAPVARSERFHGYVMSRLEVTGTIAVGGRPLAVKGSAWLEHGWGELPLPVGAVIWDRFLLHLDGGRELMVVQLRRRDGSGDPVASALLVEMDGSVRTLGEKEVTVESLKQGWRVRLEDKILDIEPYGQSLSAAIVRGETQGEGYVELGGTLGLP